MASNLRRHFADPHHSLQETVYSHDQPGHCSICLLKLAGHKGFGCYSCNIHIHRVCAGYFGETTAFIAHPSHILRLSRSPGRICNICRGDCPQGSFVYRCCIDGCGFDVHPLCAMLPETVGSRSPLHQGHDLRMVSSSSPGCCSACHHPMPMWRYVCSCSKEIHVQCAVNPPTGGAGTNGPAGIQHSNFGAGQGSQERSFGGYGGQGQQGWYSHGHGPTPPVYNPAAGRYGYGPGNHYGGPVVFQGGYGGHPGGCYAAGSPPATHGGYGATSSGHSSVFNNPGNVLSATAIAMFLVDTVISTAASEFLSQLLSGILFS